MVYDVWRYIQASRTNFLLFFFLAYDEDEINKASSDPPDQFNSIRTILYPRVCLVIKLFGVDWRRKYMYYFLKIITTCPYTIRRSIHSTLPSLLTNLYTTYRIRVLNLWRYIILLSLWPPVWTFDAIRHLKIAASLSDDDYNIRFRTLSHLRRPKSVYIIISMMGLERRSGQTASRPVLFEGAQTSHIIHHVYYKRQYLIILIPSSKSYIIFYKSCRMNIIVCIIRIILSAYSNVLHDTVTYRSVILIICIERKTDRRSQSSSSSSLQWTRRRTVEKFTKRSSNR